MCEAMISGRLLNDFVWIKDDKVRAFFFVLVFCFVGQNACNTRKAAVLKSGLGPVPLNC